MADDIDASTEEQSFFHNILVNQAINSSPGKRFTSESGFCIMCGEKIPERRLKLLPGTGLCVDCASEKEREQKKQGLVREEEMDFDA